jgi:hypothetical protein
MRTIVAAIFFFLGSIAHAVAWGTDGHRIVAEIAEQYLEPTAKRQVRDLLALDNATTLAEVSTWADHIRPQRRETARWHYVNIPIRPPASTPAAYDVTRDCPTGDCVVAAIDRFAAVLRDKGAAARAARGAQIPGPLRRRCSPAATRCRQRRPRRQRRAGDVPGTAHDAPRGVGQRHSGGVGPKG